MAEQIRVLLTGGGTGGHVYPAIAIARAIRRLEPASSIHFAGTRTHLEWRAVPAAGFDISAISARGLQRSRPLNNLAIPFSLTRGIAQAWRLLSRFDPDVVVGTGGYVSAPVLWTAARLRRPIVLQEQNAFPGKTNRWLARYARSIHIAFAEAAERLPSDRCTYSGNPTRPEFATASREEGRRLYGIPNDRLVLLMFGGSGGSAALNRAMATNIAELVADERLVILWQTGTRYHEAYRDSGGDSGRVRVLEYIDEMPATLAAADLVVCRSGAATCSELEVAGIPAVLVPSPNVADDHQTWNARSIADDGGAVLLPEADLESRFVSTIRELLDDADRRARMAGALKRRARPDAAREIATDIVRIAREGREP